MADFADRLRRDPNLYPHSYDPAGDAVLMVEMSREGFEAASFLDQRMLNAQTRARWVAARPVVETMASATRGDIAYIFHIGHVGSTLLSRMMGAHAGVHALREPATLRTLAQLKADLATPESLIAPDAFDGRLRGFVKLWARTYAPGEKTVVKATSFASELAGELLALPGAGRSLAMYVKPEVYIASILGGEGSRQELKALAQSRLRRLHARLGARPWRLYELSEGERAAASWACEMTALGSVGTGRLSWIDFEAFLVDPEAGLARALSETGFAVNAAEVSAIAAGPLMRRYSKGPEHAYTPELRAQVLDQARQEHGAEIARGMAWLEAAGRAHPLVSQALAR
jgi:hypothetical protein